MYTVYCILCLLVQLPVFMDSYINPLLTLTETRQERVLQKTYPSPKDISKNLTFHCYQRVSYLVVHPTNRKCVITLVINGISGGKSSTYN